MHQINRLSGACLVHGVRLAKHRDEADGVAIMNTHLETLLHLQRQQADSGMWSVSEALIAGLEGHERDGTLFALAVRVMFKARPGW